MRAFLCIELNKEARDELARVIKEIEKTKLISAKYVEPENLHLTLKFFGELSDAEADDIKKKLEEFKFKKFDTELCDLGYFSEDFIRVLWIALKCSEIAKLVDKIEEMFGENDKETKCHVTLARIKHVADKTKFKEFLRKLKINKTKFLVDKICLKSSVLTSKGPVYSDIFVKNLD
jgi:2'-5' RNA ligase